MTGQQKGMGIPIFKYKLLSFAISSFYAGFAGGLAAYYIGSITPEPYTLSLSVEYIAMIIIGGLGSIPGAVFGAIFITVLNELLSGATEFFMNIGSLSKIALQIAPLREFIFGLAIVLFIIFEPKGLAEVWRIVRSRLQTCGHFPIEGIMEDNVILQLNNISVVYSDVIQVLKGVSLVVKKKQIVSLLGSNGAGKTTTLKAISGLLKPENGKVTEGNVVYEGHNIHNSSPEQITRLGIIQVLEGRQPFKYLTVEENLRVGTATRWGKPYKKDLELVYHYFQPLVARKNRLAGYCSGGELQMLVMGRALMAHPKLLLLDEPSLGLAPFLVKEIFEIVKRINEEQETTIMLVEQNANMALLIAHYGYVMENGKIMMEDAATNLRENPDVKEFYLGTASSGALKSYKDVKSYKRRKRWL